MRRIGLLALSIARTAGCRTVEYPVAQLPPREDAPAYYMPPVEQEYRLQVIDSLPIRSFFDALLIQEVVVRPDGRISGLCAQDRDRLGWPVRGAIH
jgi:hypothetical protein